MLAAFDKWYGLWDKILQNSDPVAWSDLCKPIHRHTRY